jgi:hypothetical protein
MSQFTAVNPTYEEAPVAPLATTSFKEEGMEEDTGNADATEVSSSIIFSYLNEFNSLAIAPFNVYRLSDLAT